MHPIRLTIEGLRSFRHEESIDFTGRDHIAIVGDTGAGKSSILEAMTFALYGETSFAGRAASELMNDTATHMRVVLRFRVSDDIWEVVRSVRRRKKGDLAPQSAQLSRIGDGDPIPDVEQVRRVRERVEELLGLDCDAFLRTVILPQGRFARLLVEDEPKARSAILRQVWRTDELEAAGEHANAAHQLANEIRVRVEEALAGHPEDPEKHLKDLRKKVASAARQATTAGRNETKAEKCLEAIRAAGRDAAVANDVRQRLNSIDLDAVMEGLAPLAENAREMDRQGSELERRAEELESEREDIPTGDGPTSAEVAAALTTLRGLQKQLISAEESAAELRADAQVAAERRLAAARLAKRATKARERSEGHAAARPPLDEAAQGALTRTNEVEQCYSRAEQCETELGEAALLLDERRNKIATYQVPLEEAKERQRRAKGEAAEAARHLAAIRRVDSAAHAAHGLHSGDSCPVCKRELPSGWEAPAETDFARAQRTTEEAQEAVSAAAGEVTRLEAERRGALTQASEAEAAVATREARFEAARQKLARITALTLGATLPVRDIVLAPARKEQEKANAALAEHDRITEELQTDATQRDRNSQLAHRDARNADSVAATSSRSANARLGELIAGLRTVPEPFRPELDFPTEATDLQKVDSRPVASMVESAEAREALLRKRQRKLDRISAQIREAKLVRRALAERRRSEVETPLREFQKRLRRHRDVLVESVHRLGLDREVAHATASDGETLESFARELSTVLREVASVADARAERAAGEEATARARCRVIGKRLSETIDADDPDAVFRAARGRAEDARSRERIARYEAEGFATIAPHLRELRTLSGEITRKRAALQDLADALKPGRFLKWLTLRRSRELLIYASRKLREVSGGRYSFVDPQDTDEHWRVLDNDSNRPRTPASLSGGEQFLASLSLALGMVEMMERTGGRLESLFLDEGFGSLDTRNLDAAVQALETASAKRMVAVISHVRAVAEQIDHVLAVSREATGSQAKWLSARERERIAASDAETSALAGLLE